MRFGVIGGGSMASYHAYNVTRMAGATLVAFASPEYAESATNLAQRVGAECLSDVDTLCRRADIDAVIIASPTDTHMQAAVSAAQHGKHLFVEKPLARTLADAEQIVTAAERYGVKLQPGHVVRYMADYALAHTMVTSGEIGTPAVVRTTRGGDSPAMRAAGMPTWRGVAAWCLTCKSTTSTGSVGPSARSSASTPRV
jgi:predicted dehydrogenase